ncbi:MAG: inositol monophosphatase family protein [Candidatus Syntropharchaeia archaeon]
MNVDLIEIAQRIMEAVKGYIEENEDYREFVRNEGKQDTRKIDMIAEEALENELIKRNLCARIVSEEKGERVFPDGDPSFTLVFDPVDGTTNAVAGIPFFCTSLAYSPKIKNATLDDIERGVVVTAYGKTYHAVKGRGAYLGKKRISSGRSEKPILSVYAYGTKKKFHIEGDVLIRVLGSIAIEVCLVAEGAMDAVADVRGKINGYDLAASALILRESGGIITDLDGNPLKRGVNAKKISFIASGNKKIHEMMLRCIE